jgi:tetratricopeptide (TPR) repeat protein
LSKTLLPNNRKELRFSAILLLFGVPNSFFQRTSNRKTMKTLSAFCLVSVLTVGLSPLANAQGNAEAIKLNHQGTAAAKAGDWDKAIEAFRKAAELDRKQEKNLAAALQQRGAADMAQQNFSQAAADFSEALRINPKDAGIYERRAYVEMKLGDNDKALADYSEAIKLSPQEVRYYNLRSYIYEVKGDIKNSKADTEKVLKLDKHNAEARSRKERLKKIEAMNAQSALNATPIPAPTAAAGSPAPNKP